MNQPREMLERKDDWTGITDPVERKKRQNRLHQRAWRRRRAAQLQQCSESHIWALNSFVSDSALSPTSKRQALLASEPSVASLPSPLPTLSGIWRPILIKVSPEKQASSQHEEARQGEVVIPLISPVIPYLTTKFSHFTIPPFNFPILPDHQLLPLIQYNVLRAIMTNMSLMTLFHRLPLECGAAYAIPTIPTNAQTVPPWLLPTKTQLSVPHDPWIDTFPVAAMRDNLIMYQGRIDNDDLCCDVVGGLYEGYNDLEKRGVLVWSDPWHPDSWEVTEGFAEKWGFLLRGCDDLLRATNKWRSLRGEKRLVFKV